MTFLTHRYVDLAALWVVAWVAVVRFCGTNKRDSVFPPDPPSHCVKRPLAYDWSTEPEEVA